MTNDQIFITPMFLNSLFLPSSSRCRPATKGPYALSLLRGRYNA